MPQAHAEQRDALRRLVSQLEPGARLRRTRELRGGLSARMQALDAIQEDGSRLSIVLRRFHPEFRSAVERATREFRTLQVLQDSPVTAPRPLWLDAAGQRFGTPAMALTYLPGRVVIAPSRPGPWLGEAAHILRVIQAVSPQSHDLSHLEVRGENQVRGALEPPVEARLEGNVLAEQITSTLRAAIDRVQWLPACLVHGDYWPANLIWYRRQLSGVVDWTFAVIGDPREDVAQYRLDLALIYGDGLELADAFLGAYNLRSPAPLREVWFFDLLRGLGALKAVSVYDEWLKGYHDLGLTQITPEMIRARLSRFIETALASSRLGVSRG